MAEPVEVGWLKGVRVCLCAHYVPGPLAAYLLQCLGAEVIKVEPPSHDMLRAYPPFFEGADGERMGAWFRTLNGGFKSMVIDFKQGEGGAVLQGLLRHCDVLIDGHRPGYLSRVLGMAPEDVHAGLVYLPISAYGQQGPLRDVAGHDANLLAMAGNLSYTAPGAGGLPALFSAPVADILAAHTAALCAVAALLGRQTQRGGEIRRVDSSMYHAAFFLNQMQVAAMNLVAQAPVAGQAWMNGGMANYRPYTTADGQTIMFAPIEPHLFGQFCQRLGRPDLIPLCYQDDLRLGAELEVLFAARPLAEWEQLLADCDCCFSPVLPLDKAMEHPQAAALGLVQDLEDPRLGAMKLAAFPAGFGPESASPTLAQTAPRPGEHSVVLLRELMGFSEAEIDRLLGTGTVAGRI